MHNWWVAELWQDDPPWVFFWTFWVIVSIVLHELGHGIAAIRCGDRTPIELGHMTWNPLVHMGQMSLLMFALVGIAWGAMPVSPNRFRGRHAEAQVAAAGPQVNLILFVLCGIAAGMAWNMTYGHLADLDPAALLTGEEESSEPLIGPRVFEFFRLGAILNLVLLALNLLPVPPLDGSRILGDFSRRYRLLVSHPNAGIWVFGVFIAVFLLGGEHLFGFSRDASDWFIGLFINEPDLSGW